MSFRSSRSSSPSTTSSSSSSASSRPAAGSTIRATAFEIQLLDDSTDETTAVAREIVERYAAGFGDLAPQPIFYLHRTNRYGYKAGALDAGLKVARGEFVAIFDADFVPPVDWVHKVVHHFAEPGVGMVQTRWTHLNRNYSFLTQVEAILLDGHFVLEHGGRSRAGVFFNFNGTAGIWRTKVIGEAGGWQHDTLTEDTDLSYRAQLIGWKFKYLQDVECPAELPIEMTAFKTQQARWAKGLIQTGKKILPRVLKSDAPFHIKLEAWYHLTANLSYPLMIVLSTLLMPAMIIRSYQGWIQMMLIDFPLFMASTMSVSSFYLVSQKELFPGRWYKTFLYLPVSDGAWRRPDNHQHQGRDGGPPRRPKRVCPHAEVLGEEEGREEPGPEVSQTPGLDSVDRAVDRLLLRRHGLVRGYQRELLHGAVFCCCSSSATGTPACSACCRDASSVPAQPRMRSRIRWGFRLNPAIQSSCNGRALQWNRFGEVSYNCRKRWAMASPAQTAQRSTLSVTSTPDERFAALDEFLSMYGLFHDLYERVGGAEEWHRKEQAAWNESSLA